jgi:hypothetical protein
VPGAELYPFLLGLVGDLGQTQVGQWWSIGYGIDSIDMEIDMDIDMDLYGYGYGSIWI